MGGMLVAGLLLARFLKSSSPEATDNDFVYAGGGGGTGTRSTGTVSAGERRADVDTAWQPESGAYGGSTQRPNSPAAGTPNSGTSRALDLAPDDETDLGL